MIETTVVIPHASSTETLIAVLAQLQIQTVLPVHIYIIDCGDEKSGLRIAKKFCFNTVPITVEVVKGTIQENWNRGIQFSQTDHPNASILVINDDILIPNNAIELFQEAESLTSDLAYTAETPDKTHYASEVTTYMQSKGEITRIEKTDWMSGFCFYLTPRCIHEVGYFDEQFKVWYGDTDYEKRIQQKGAVKIIRGLYIYHFGGKSYKYYSKEVQDLIAKDRELFYTKHK